MMNASQQVEPGWYPDPGQPGYQRYWDGIQWTPQTAPYPAAPSAPLPFEPSSNRRLSTGAIVAIVIGAVVVAGILVIALLTAAAVPVYNEQRSMAVDAAARADVSTLGLEIATYMVDSDPSALELTMNQDAYEFTADRQTWGFTAREGVTLGGLTGTGALDWCVWVSAPDGEVGAAQYSAQHGLQDGPCP